MASIEEEIIKLQKNMQIWKRSGNQRKRRLRGSCHQRGNRPHTFSN
jgi:hypothetical protein